MEEKCEENVEGKYEKKWEKFFSYYKPHKRVFLADLFFAFLGAAVSLILPLIIRYITGTVVQQPRDQAFHSLIWLILAMLALVLVECYSNYFITFYGHMMGAKIEFAMRREIFEHYQKLSFSFYDNQKVGQLMSRITNDLFDITELCHHGPEDVIISIVKFVGSFGILLSINWKLALIAVAVIPPMGIYAYFFNSRMKRAFKNNRARIADINANIEDNLSGIRVVKSFANEQVEQEKFDQGNHRFLDTKSVSYHCMAQYNAGLGAFITSITIVVIAAAAFLMNGNALSTTDLITFLLYIGNFTDPVKKLVAFTEQFQNGMSGYERFLDMLAIQPDIKDQPGARELAEVKGDVQFNHVSFCYEPGQAEVLHDVNLHVLPGDYVALVGSSGAGKTTLCSLIPRFYEATEGQVEIDGQDVRTLTQQSLRQNVGIVQQDVYLFAGTVLDNIRYGKPDATDEEILRAARNANAHEFIMELPQGYETNIGQRGVKLSGGQKQRLSIARVFLKNPPILIFDEATSALDNESEKVVQDSLEKLAKNRTTFVIAHRLSTIRNAKKILVLTEEGIAEEGTHQELLDRGGIYAELYKIAGL